MGYESPPERKADCSRVATRRWSHERQQPSDRTSSLAGQAMRGIASIASNARLISVRTRFLAYYFPIRLRLSCSSVASLFRRFANPSALSAILALLVFAITLNGVFIYDDVAVIEKDKRIANPALWGQYWTDSYNFGVDNLSR
jgi:hypothetical protein